jgi:hypothetical protein
MTAGSTSHIPVIFCLGFAAALFGQIDSYQLRAKYGPPLDRETFTISPGYQIVVDYGPDHQASRLELPPAAPSLDQPGVITQKRVDDILLELVPMSMRGKEIRSMLQSFGVLSIKSTEYEHVIISEPQGPSQTGLRTGVTVVFKSSATSLFDQIDSYHLRAKYGPPLDSETFTIVPGFELIVDYGPDQQACRLALPADRKQVDDFLLELVPMPMRGKQLNGGAFMSGPNIIKFTFYEHLVISEPGNANGRVSVSFNREVCRTTSGEFPSRR